MSLWFYTNDYSALTIIIYFLCMQTIQDWMLFLIVLLFVAIDVIILVVYLIYNGVRGTLSASELRNAENPHAELDVSDYCTCATVILQIQYNNCQVI